MLMPVTIPMREILRNWRAVFNKVKKNKMPLVILSNNEPQAALVDLDLLEKIRLDEAADEAFKEFKKGDMLIINSEEELKKHFEELKKEIQK